MDHTSLGCWAWAKGSPQLVALRRRLRRLTRPARSSMPLAVLGDGQGTSGSMERSQATTFFGPHVGRLRFASTMRSTTCVGVALGW